MPLTDDHAPPAPAPPLKVAFIGGGINSAVGGAHFNALHLDGLYELVAGSFSRDPTTNAASAHRYGVPAERTYARAATLIEREADALDAVIVLTPTTAHVPPVVAALEAGIPVICEKALASNLDEVAAIRQAEARSGGFLAVTYNYTGYPALRELRALIQAGRLGRILHFVAEMPQEGFIRRGAEGNPLIPQAWRLQDGPVPTVYLDLGVHLHQIADYLTGARPRRVTGFHSSYGNFTEIVDFVSAAVEYENGIFGDFYFGKSMLGYRNGLKIRIFGSDASAEWEQVNPETIRLAHADGRIETLDRGAAVLVCNQPRYTRFKAGHPAGYIEAFANLYVDLHEALDRFHAGEPWQSADVAGSGLAHDGLRLLDAMARAAAGGSAVELDAR
ncbi:Gfo/Idh/MocA family protein [Endothiovibrio diazotrophicus]